jgi:hypothetical protein
VKPLDSRVCRGAADLISAGARNSTFVILSEAKNPSGYPPAMVGRSRLPVGFFAAMP